MFLLPRLAPTAVLLTLLLPAPATPAAPYPNLSAALGAAQRNGSWYRRCMEVRRAAAPAAEGMAATPPCDAMALYDAALDAGGSADWQRVRACALQPPQPAVLMMLYANGDGVATDLALATKFACSIESSPAEMLARVERLRRLRPPARLDVCSDAGSAAGLATCAARQERRRDAARSATLSLLSRQWSTKAQAALSVAAAAARAFAERRAEDETDHAGAGGALQTETLASELERFTSDIADFDKGRLPRGTEAEYRVLEAEMDAAYQRFLHTPPAPDAYLGGIRKSGVERTQRAFLAYRDAMEMLGSVRYPAVPGAAWRALLTHRRLRQLTGLADAAAGR